MSAPVRIIDSGSKKSAKVSSIGQLVTGRFAYNLSSFKELAVNDTAYNFYAPKVGHQFVIDGIIARADKQVSSTVDATVIIYEANSTTSLTVDKVIFQLAMVQDTVISVFGLNLLVTEGFFINAKTDDDDIHMNILGYFIPVVA